MPPPDLRLIARRAEIVGALEAAAPGAVIDDPIETRAYECDALSAYRCAPMAVVLPRSTAEVAAILRVCSAEGVPVIPRGAGTSLAGGSMPTADSVVVGLARMTRVLEIAPEDRLVRVEVGRTNQSDLEGLVGRPSAAGVLTGAAWYYVGSRWEYFGAREPREIDRQVVAVSFTENGTVSNVERFGLEHGRVVALSRRVTDGGVRSSGLLRQLLGNIGRVQAGELLGD